LLVQRLREDFAAIDNMEWAKGQFICGERNDDAEADALGRR
jgi:hypothetical protein